MFQYMQKSNALPEDWSATPESTSSVPGSTAPKKGKRKRKNQYTPVDDPNLPQPGLGGVAPTTPPEQATDTGVYDSAVADQMMRAPTGSFAGGYWGPSGIDALADSPGMLIDAYYGQQYGLGPGSNAGQLANEYLNPLAKQYGILGGNTPQNNIDAVNFGASLLANAQGMGMQLSPASMVQTIMSTLASESKSMAKGGAVTGASDSVLASIAHNPKPAEAIGSLIGILQGALEGTMPDDALDAFLNHVTRMGNAFALEWATKDPAISEAQGDTFITRLMQQLGPTLGL